MAGAFLGLAGLWMLDRLIQHPDFVVVGLFVAHGVLPALGGVAGAALPPPDFGDVAELVPAQVWQGRASTLCLVLVVGVAVLRPGRDRRGRSLLAGALAYCLAAVFTEIYAGDGFPRGSFEIAAGVTALWLAPRLEPGVVVAAAKAAAGLFCVGSFAALLAGLPGATVPYDVGVLPGLAFRLQGITAHANALAPLPVLFGLLEWCRPSRPLVRWPLVIIAAVLLALTQSKTAWIAALTLALIIVAGGWRTRRARLATAAGVLAMLAAFTVYSYVGNEQVSSAVEEARTFTGRTELWQLGLERWGDSPLWGGGPRFFEDYAQRTRQPWAGQAHNQVIEVLAERGLIGIIGLALYLAALSRSALRSAEVSRTTSLGLVALLGVRCLTETPFAGFDLLHLTVVALLLSWERVPRPPIPPPRGTAYLAAAGTSPPGASPARFPTPGSGA